MGWERGLPKSAKVLGVPGMESGLGRGTLEWRGGVGLVDGLGMGGVPQGAKVLGVPGTEQCLGRGVEEMVEALARGGVATGARLLGLL